MSGSRRRGDGTRLSSWFCVARPQLWVGSAVGAALLTCACAQAEPSYSPSWQEGYDSLLKTGREAVSDAESQGVSGDSLQVFAGSSDQVAETCNGLLQATIGGFSRTGGWPNNFNSQDYLDGCRAAGDYMLKPGAK